MSIDQMRLAIAECYSGWKWKNRVANMAVNQVVAIFKKFEAEGRFNKPKKLQPVTQPKLLYHQIDMFEYLNNLKEETNERKSQFGN